MLGSRITLDNPVLASRRRTSDTRRSTYERRAVLPVRARNISDVSSPKPKALVKKAKPAVQQHVPRTSHSTVLKREAIQRRPTSRHRRRRNPLKGRALSTLAILLFMFGIGVGVISLRGNHKVMAQAQHLAQQVETKDDTATDTPSEAPTKPTGPYRVAPDLPRVLRISKIGVEARVLRTTVKANNQLGAPSSIFDTAWYDGSSKPGEAGAMLIDGHVSGPTQHGVFYDLKKLGAGDKMEIERGDGKVFTYTVVKTQTYDVDNVDMAAALTPVTRGKAGLNLMTCTGQIDDSGNHFKQRLVVFTQQD